ncbi:threonyl-trna synthetase [Methylobacterium sp. WL9]|uniref:threonyl-trna synthetase n=1 Tax=Methylobacterium sp. WL9 TaxID=2603898 RepID=UPI0011CC7132|nr:threonyl-trna synthetase [Methylobacterium sp. WL9]TXN25067.1 threonyl-trna synthetase [Methylobacterium sp. WL9]
MTCRWGFTTAFVLAALAGTAHAAERPAGEGPFGLAWGPVDRIDTPSMIDREANLTGLYYLHDKPLASGPDTVEVVLVVCREEGLQQVVWVGRPLADAAHVIARDAVRREGILRYGKPRPGPVPGSLEWPSGRTVLATRAMPDGTRELVMSASGPDYAACSESHRAATGHPADAHVAELLGPGVP